jgi:DNA mismatch repair ATPase MutS
MSSVQVEVYNMDCYEDEEEKKVIFFYKLKKGSAGSRGLNVAKLAGVCCFNFV